ncbi:MAG: 2-hydroxyacyl-CoA dehydratase [Coriobacteriales bacterium]|nr:2-hydroxyacyl-CoA dehydratase [Coriobacteriales bacterium]
MVQMQPAKSVAGKVLAKIAENVYEEGLAAKARGEMVGWISSNFPQEIPMTLGLHCVYPESQAAAISAKGAGLEMCEHAEGELGLSNDICAYSRISQAYADLAKCPNNEREMPLPDFVLCCNNICDCMLKWYENLGQMLNIPVIVIDVPFSNKYDIDRKRIEYVGAQFRDAIKQLEEVTGKKWDEKKFEHVCEVSSQIGDEWLKATKYLNYKPAPYKGFDLFNHMAVATMARGQEDSLQALKDFNAECEEFIKEHKSTFKDEEKHRVMFEGIACWPYLRVTYSTLKNLGCNVTSCVYGPSFAFSYKTFDEMIECYCSVPNAINLERSTDQREQLCQEGKVDGGLVHINRSCKMWSATMPEMARRISRDLNIPVVTFDGDQSDPRNFSEEQYVTRVQGLVEIMESNAKKGA